MLHKAIHKINPTAEFTINADDINQITWLNGTQPIPANEILAIIPQVELDIAMETLRAKRDALLKASDWEVIKAKETGSTLSVGFKTYRQALRDITEGLTTVAQVNAVVFPEKP